MSVIPSIVTPITIVLEIMQNIVLTSQIELELKTFAERCKNSFKIIGLYFQERLPKRLVVDELKYVCKLKSRFFVATIELDIAESTVSIWNNQEYASHIER